MYINKKNTQSKSAHGYCHNKIFIAMKRTKGCIITVEGSVAKYLSHAKQKTCCIPHIYKYTVLSEKDEYIV